MKQNFLFDSLSPAVQIGWTPLHAMANYCPADKAMPVAKLLLDAGAAVGVANSVSHLWGRAVA